MNSSLFHSSNFTFFFFFLVLLKRNYNSLQEVEATRGYNNNSVEVKAWKKRKKNKKMFAFRVN